MFVGREETVNWGCLAVRSGWEHGVCGPCGVCKC